MHLNKSKAFTLAVLLATLSLVGAGCGTPTAKPVAWNLSFTKKTPASIVIDIVGVSPLDKGRLSSIPVEQWWKSDLRKEVTKVTQQLPTGEPWILSITDPIWKQWRSYGATELMIMATLPCKDCDDRRRILVPLDKNSWVGYKNKTLEFEVQDQWIHVLTPQKP
jgi:hypothetical protein